MFTVSASTHFISIIALFSYPACDRASTTDKYASCSLVYFPTKAIFTVLSLFLTLSSILVQSLKSHLSYFKSSSLQTISHKFCSSNIIGTSYNTSIVLFSITQSGFTLQNNDIFFLITSSIGASERVTIIFGIIPKPCNCLTECCVGFDLCSPELFIYGTNVTCINKQLCLPTSNDTCLIASKKG